MSRSTDASLLAAAPWWRADPGRRLVIRGGARLVGTYPISGAKNAVLPLMISALLTPHLVTLHNVPASLDVAVLSNLLQRLGVGLGWSAGDTGLSLTLCADRIRAGEVDRDLVGRMRASVLLLGALLGRCGEACLPMPGGDAIGLRGIDFHAAGLRAMGAEVELAGGMIRARAPHGLRGAEIALPLPSVGATENLLLAAVLARGETVIRNAAREPEIADLAACLVAMGAAIDGQGSDVLTIRGGRRLGGAIHGVMPDRIELGTIACAAGRAAGRGRRRPGRAPGAGRPGRHRPADPPVSRLRHRPAGPCHGDAGHRRRRQRDHRDDLRAALPPCRRAAQDGRPHHRARPHRLGARHAAADRRRGDRDRRPRRRGPGPGRPGGTWGDGAGRARSPRPRL
jgi:UDP-N-acetylglucosamine 1-carboxyvinyltransferase